MTDDNERQRFFSNWLRVRPWRLFGLPPIGLGAGAVGLIVGLFSVLGGQWFLLLATVLAVTIFLLAFVVRWGQPDAGRTLISRLADRADSDNRRNDGSSMYHTGPLSALPADRLYALPGALLDVDEIDGVDGTGQPYTLLHHKAVDAMAATLMCVPDGLALQPQSTINTQLRDLGGWIAGHSNDPALTAAVIVVDSALTESEPLKEQVRATWSPSAPELAIRHQEEKLRNMPARGAQTDVYASLIWNRREFGSVPDAAAEIASRLPDHRSALYSAGGGVPENATSEDLARMTLVAYRPERAHEFAIDDLLGHSNPLRLSQAGPEFLDEGADPQLLFHDGVCSMTAVMLVPPRMHITEKTMLGLFAPQDRFLRKRVAIYYRPLSPAEAIATAGALNSAAGIEATSKRRASGFDNHKVNQAQKTENELVVGAAMTRFMMTVTVTVRPTEKAIRDGRNKLKNLLSGTNIAYRIAEHGKAPLFHATLPLGIVPWLYQGEIALWLEQNT